MARAQPHGAPLHPRAGGANAVINDLQRLLPLNDHRTDIGGFSVDPADLAHRITELQQQIDRYEGGLAGLHAMQQQQRYLRHELAWLDERGL